VAAKKRDVKAAPGREAAKKKPFDMRQLWRMALWAATASGALLLAVLSSRSEVGSQRLAVVIASLHGQTAPPPFDAQVETRKLANALRGLSSENDQLRSRLAAVENHVDDVTGSLTRQIEAVKAEAEAPRPTDTPPAAATTDLTGSTPQPAPAPTAVPVAPPPGRAQTPPPAKPADPNSSSVTPKQYGVDIGSAASIQALRARWAEIRAAHPQLFQGLTPTAVLASQSDHAELRLVMGPLPNSDAATRLCSSLALYHLNCQPTGFDGQHVALQ
jgi:hypothetical protein